MKPEIDDVWYCIGYFLEDVEVYSDKIYSYEKAKSTLKEFRVNYPKAKLYYNWETSVELEIE